MASLSKFKLGVVEEEGVVLNSSNVKKCREDCERSLMGKIWGSKSANFQGVNMGLRSLGITISSSFFPTVKTRNESSSAGPGSSKISSWYFNSGERT